MPVHDKEHPYTLAFLIALVIFMTVFAYNPRILLRNPTNSNTAIELPPGQDFLVIRPRHT